MNPSIVVKGGSLYMPRAIYDLHLAGLASIILLRRDHDLLILPVRHAAAGGYLLKLRNRGGDRVVTAPDFFRSQGIDDHTKLEFQVDWSVQHGGLLAISVFEV